MSHEPHPAETHRALLDANRMRPALWRWMAFWTLVLVVVSLWIPVIHVGPPPAGGWATAFTLQNFALLGVLVLLAALVMPALPWIRLVFAACLVGSTMVAWALEAPIREFLGGQFATPGA